MGSNWNDSCSLNSKSYTCSYCGEYISSEIGYYKFNGRIYICHNCDCPTFFDNSGKQYPGNPYGIDVKYISAEEVNILYNEAKSCMGVNAYTATILCCRKLLMNIAVSNGAKEGLKFIEYVNYLNDKGYIPPNGRPWADSIRKKGNEATHEIKIMTSEEAKLLLDFLGMLLKFMYEFPEMLKQSQESS